MHRFAWIVSVVLVGPSCGDDGDDAATASGSATDPEASGTGDGEATGSTGTSAAAETSGGGSGEGSGGLLTTGDGSTGGADDETGGAAACEDCEPGEVCVRGSECSGDACTSTNACLPDPGAAVINCTTAGATFCAAFGPDHACYDEATGPYCCAGEPDLCASAG